MSMVNTRGKNRPRLELKFRSFELVAVELETIRILRWPITIIAAAIAISLLILAARSHPVEWFMSAISYAGAMWSH
jgi:hypothetical protein